MDLMSIYSVSVVSAQGAVTEHSFVYRFLVQYSLDGNEWIVLTDKGGRVKVCFSQFLTL